MQPSMEKKISSEISAISLLKTAVFLLLPSSGSIGILESKYFLSNWYQSIVVGPLAAENLKFQRPLGAFEGSLLVVRGRKDGRKKGVPSYNFSIATNITPNDVPTITGLMITPRWNVCLPSSVLLHSELTVFILLCDNMVENNNHLFV
ncbi:hypothetical protein IEQ34_016290 [Dendrobium chrysotoxum]|uniref:Uncharacterized protein n=1 Tax=Dendrobium chrysotoxum TaxID=161865 RepID=A0AAV7GD24_DENCH|nr:hypothetical protein IEQ34_016290 [Dendrobium chrysotoxum]